MVGRIARELGHPLFPWQQYVVDVALEVDERDEWVYDEIAVLAPRRSGKTFLEQALMAQRCSRARSLVAMTAQNGQEAAARWLEVVDTEGGSGIMQTPLASILHATTGTGNKVLTWPNGSTFVPFTPNEKALHGSPPDLVFIDELWAFNLPDKVMLQQAYRPAWSVKVGQEWLLSAAGTMASGWLHDVRRRGKASLKAQSTRMAFFDWGIADGLRKASDAELVDAVIQAHPRRDHGLRHAYIAAELENLGRSSFLRAYGNVDAEGDEGQSAVPVERLAALTSRTDRITAAEPVVLGVAVDQQRRESTICAAQHQGGKIRVEVVRHASGTKWVAAYVADMPNVQSVTVLNVGVARDLADQLELLEVPLERVSQADAAAATGRWLSTVAETDTLSLDGSVRLEQALVQAEAPRGGGAWQSRTGEPITAVVAHTLALWGMTHGPEVEPELPPFKVW